MCEPAGSIFPAPVSFLIFLFRFKCISFKKGTVAVFSGSPGPAKVAFVIIMIIIFVRKLVEAKGEADENVKYRLFV